MSEKVYNLDQLNELAAGSEEFVETMIETYLEHTPKQLRELIEAYKAKDFATVSGIAHKIKPNLDLIGLNVISEDIRLVEDRGKRALDDDDLRNSLDKVKTYLELSFSQLRTR